MAKGKCASRKKIVLSSIVAYQQQIGIILNVKMKEKLKIDISITIVSDVLFFISPIILYLLLNFFNPNIVFGVSKIYVLCFVFKICVLVSVLLPAKPYPGFLFRGGGRVKKLYKPIKIYYMHFCYFFTSQSFL